MEGVVHQVSVSPGGVPKHPVAGPVLVHASGVTGDDQANKKHHGGPEQHICLYSLEVIDGLRAEGHPIYPGAAGENITISGLDWLQLARGQRMHIGDEVELEITWPATPCGKNAQWFSDRDSNRMSDELHPGKSRWYAKVITTGSIEAGSKVVVKT